MLSLKQLQQELDYFFKDTSLLTQALTHRSYGRSNYERLEFVGDGILDYVIALNLYQNYPDFSEGELSKIRAALVNQDALVEVATGLKLGEFLRLGDGEEKSGGRARPSILADSLEAIFAAISIDANFDVSRAVIEKLYKDKLLNAELLILKDSKSLLQEYLQAQKIMLPSYNVLESSGPDHDSIFSVECVVPEIGIKVTARGKSKKEASQIAAEKVLYLVREREA